jgi:hypothetical protein
MIWVVITGLLLGVLLAQRFRITILLPATLAVAVVVFGVARTRVSDASSIVLIIIVASASMQAAYFVSILVRRAMRKQSRLGSLSKTHQPEIPCARGKEFRSS